MSRHYIIPIFVPHYGCPNDCVFCNQRKITGLSTDLTEEDVEEIILNHLKSFKDNSFIEIAFYGGSFTAIDINIQKKLLNVALKYKKNGRVNEIRISTRPDSIDDNILSMLKEFQVNTIELGVQSLDYDVLALSNRGHLPSHVYEACKLIKRYDFDLGLQMMLGLPGDTFIKSINTANEFIRLEPECVRIYPTLVIKSTQLEEDYLKGLYKPMSLDEAIKLSAILLIMFKLEDINVIRVGLQPTENIQLGKDVVAGPFHPAFRQLVEANIIRKILDFYFLDKQIDTNMKNLKIESYRKNVSNIAGQKSSNIKYMKDQYKFNEIKLYSKDMDKNIIHISIDDIRHSININQAMKLLIKKIN